MPRVAHRGQTLLELLTALFVLATVLVGGLALTNSNFRLEGIGSSRLVATNVAREGIELARAIRDSNWLSGRAFDAGLTDTNHCAVIAFEDQQPFVDHFAFVECADVFGQSFQLAKSANGRYASDPDFGDPTQLFRLIRLDPICLNITTETISTDGDCGSDTKIGVAIHAEVGWYYAGQKMNLSLNEYLYDWQ